MSDLVRIVVDLSSEPTEEISYLSQIDLRFANSSSDHDIIVADASASERSNCDDVDSNKRSRRIIESADSSSSSEYETDSEIQEMPPEELYETIQSKLIHRLLDCCLVLLKNCDDRRSWFLHFENRHKDLENKAYQTLRRLRKEFGVRVEDADFLNGFDNPEIALVPPGMTKEEYNSLTICSEAESRTHLKWLLEQAELLWMKLEKVKVKKIDFSENEGSDNSEWWDEEVSEGSQGGHNNYENDDQNPHYEEAREAGKRRNSFQRLNNKFRKASDDTEAAISGPRRRQRKKRYKARFSAQGKSYDDQGGASTGNQHFDVSENEKSEKGVDETSERELNRLRKNSLGGGVSKTVKNDEEFSVSCLPISGDYMIPSHLLQVQPQHHRGRSNMQALLDCVENEEASYKPSESQVIHDNLVPEDLIIEDVPVLSSGMQEERKVCEKFPSLQLFPGRLHSDFLSVLDNFLAEPNEKSFMDLDNQFAVFAPGCTNISRVVLDITLSNTLKVAMAYGQEDFGIFLMRRALQWCVTLKHPKAAGLTLCLLVHKSLISNWNREVIHLDGELVNEMSRACEVFKWKLWIFVNEILVLLLKDQDISAKTLFELLSFIVDDNEACNSSLNPVSDIHQICSATAGFSLKLSEHRSNKAKLAWLEFAWSLNISVASRDLIASDNWSWIASNLLCNVFSYDGLIEWKSVLSELRGQYFHPRTFVVILCRRCRYLQKFWGPSPSAISAELWNILTRSFDSGKSFDIAFDELFLLLREELAACKSKGAKLRFCSDVVGRLSPPLAEIEAIAEHCVLLTVFADEPLLKDQLAKISKKVVFFILSLSSFNALNRTSFLSIGKIVSSLGKLGCEGSAAFVTEDFCNMKSNGKWREDYRCSPSTSSVADVLVFLLLKLCEGNEVQKEKFDAIEQIVLNLVGSLRKWKTSHSKQSFSILHLIVPIGNAVLGNPTIFEQAPAITYHTVSLLREIISLVEEFSTSTVSSNDDFDAALAMTAELAEAKVILERSLVPFFRTSIPQIIRESLVKNGFIDQVIDTVNFAGSLAASVYKADNALKSPFQDLFEKYGLFDRWSNAAAVSGDINNGGVEKTYYLVPALFISALLSSAEQWKVNLIIGGFDKNNIYGVFWMSYFALGCEMHESLAQFATLCHLDINGLLATYHGVCPKSFEPLQTIFAGESVSFRNNVDEFLCKVAVSSSLEILSSLVEIALMRRLIKLAFRTFYHIVSNSEISVERNPFWRGKANALLDLACEFLAKEENQIVDVPRPTGLARMQGFLLLETTPIERLEQFKLRVLLRWTFQDKLNTECSFIPSLVALVLKKMCT